MNIGLYTLSKNEEEKVETEVKEAEIVEEKND